VARKLESSDVVEVSRSTRLTERLNRALTRNEPGAKGTRAVEAGRRRRQTPHATVSLREGSSLPRYYNHRPLDLVPSSAVTIA
jgi:hypothetical protein